MTTRTRGPQKRRHLSAPRRYTRLGAERLEHRSLLAALMSYELKILPPNAPFTGTELTSVILGESYDVAVAVKDLRPTGTGVFAAFLDILYDPSKTQVRVGELQTIQISGGTSGDFTLGFGGQTTAPIPADASDSELAALIKTELEALSNIAAGDIRVRKTSSTNGFQVRFGGSLLDQNVPTMTVGGPAAAGIAVSTDGELASDLAFRESWRSPLSQMYPHLIPVSSPISLPDRIDDIGAVMDLFAQPGTLQRELIRARFQATALGQVTFTPDLTDVESPLGDTLVLTDPERGLTLEEMQIGPAKTLTIFNTPLIAVNDIATVPEDSPATAIDVLANDTSLPGSTREIVSVTQPIKGSATFTASGVSYTPAANFFGVETFTYTLKSYVVDPSAAMFATATVTVTVTGVNDAPTLDPLADAALLEDAGQQSIDLQGIGSGPGESQLLTITAESSNPELISQPTIVTDPLGKKSVSYAPAANRSGTAVITVKVKDDGGGASDAVERSFTVTVAPVNDAPDFLAGANQTVQDDSGPHTTDGWATAIAAGPPDEAGQALTFSVATDNDQLFATLPAVDAAGRLTFTPALNGHGTALVTVTLKDNGGSGGGANDTSTPQTFSVTVEKLQRLQNSELPSDVNGDDEVAPFDALLIVNYLNAGNPTKVSPTASATFYYDVNGDNEIAPLDPLLILNDLNAGVFAEGEGATSAVAPPAAPSASEQLPGDIIAALAEDLIEQSSRRRRPR